MAFFDRRPRGRKLNVLIACEESGVVRDAIRARGHEAWSCDLKPNPSPFHIVGDAAVVAYDKVYGWDAMIGHPPCTYMANSGALRLYVDGKKGGGRDPERWRGLEAGIAFFHKLRLAPIPQVALENPVPHYWASRRMGKPAQLIQPWMFGHKATKATGLWLDGFPKLVPTDVVGPLPDDPEERQKWHVVMNLSPSPLRQEIRSRTFDGIAKAMAEQWFFAV